LFCALFCLGLVFAGEQLYQVYEPTEPNITYFELGQQAIIFFPPEDSSYDTISIVSNDFEVTPSVRTIPGDTAFYIKGNSAGTKNFTVTVSGTNKSYSYESSINISPKEVEIDGPYILTDFDFSKVYTTEQEIDFYCLGSRNHPTNCINQTTYLFDGETKDFNYGDTIKFNFSGTKQITLYAKNTFGKKTTKTFTLTINQKTETPANETNNEQHNNSNNNGGAGVRPLPSTNNKNETNIITNDINSSEDSSNSDSSSDLVTTNLSTQEYIEPTTKTQNEPSLSVEQNDNNSVEQNISGLFTLPALKGKNKIFIILISVILLMSMLLFLTRKKEVVK